MLEVATSPDAGFERAESIASSLGEPLLHVDRLDSTHRHTRWVVAIATCWTLFVNHYARDVTGALVFEIESDFAIDSTRFQTLNACYFAPNLVMPAVVGVLAQRYGASKMLIACTAFSSFGHAAVAVAGYLRSYGVLLGGRVALGICYEAIDVLPLAILAPLFSDCWAFMGGLFNAFLRMGSVLNFVVSPIVYKHSGIEAALTVSCLMGISGLAVAIVAFNVDASLKSRRVRSCEHASQKAESPCARGERKKGSGMQTFRMYIVLGAFMYASLVPFWFYGGGYIQHKWGYGLAAADALMLYPEGGMVILSPVLGILVDKLLRRVRTRLIVLCCSLISVSISFLLLTLTPAHVMPPFVALGVLGTSYAFSNTCFWSLSNVLVPADFYGTGGGILGVAINVGATVLPVIMARAPTEAAALLLLGAMAFLAASVSVLLSCGHKIA
eukprot:TRINITY_DN28906_c0_g2_i1.p1 TRINITY_DN28906_c0_g2~~TRINITY_DN28906_c0_g2_i1.p1  ORF type:complete len:442 (+),score=33.65 TRINITY_DN28906_c0_g2_i1:167-1492(+)